MHYYIPCKFSAAYLAKFPNKAHRLGHITGQSRDGKRWWVILSGNEAPMVFDKADIDVLKLETKP